LARDRSAWRVTASCVTLRFVSLACRIASLGGIQGERIRRFDDSPAACSMEDVSVSKVNDTMHATCCSRRLNLKTQSRGAKMPAAMIAV